MTSRAFHILALLLLPSLAVARDSLLVRQFYPIAPYIFFDSSSAEWPARYERFISKKEADSFDDRTLAGDAMTKQHRVLDVIGSRLRRYPTATVEIIGSCSAQPHLNENRELSLARAHLVRQYLSDIWGIDTARLRLRALAFPNDRRSVRYPEWIVEYRNVEIRPDDWRILAPIVQLDKRPIDPSDSIPRLTPGLFISPSDPLASEEAHLTIAPLIYFKYDSPQMGATNEKIVMEYLLPVIASPSFIEITGHTDLTGLEDRNKKLSSQRADSTAAFLRRHLPAESMQIKHRGVGESELFPNSLTEGRHFNQTVMIVVWRKM